MVMTRCVMAITDPRLPSPDRWIEAAVEAAAAGVDFVQLRAREVERAVVRDAASRLMEASSASGARVLINGDVALAVEVGAHGVHLPSDGGSALAARRLLEDALGRGVWVTRACHTFEDLARASVEGVDLCTWSPVFAPRSKTTPFALQGLEGLAAACRVSQVPLLALGGIDAERAPRCIEAGAAGVAVIGAVFGGGPVGEAVEALRKAIGRP